MVKLQDSAVKDFEEQKHGKTALNLNLREQTPHLTSNQSHTSAAKAKKLS